jgi:hypothetical protein
VPLEEALLKISRNLTPAGDEKLLIKGEMTIANLMPAIDPVANGVSLTVRDQSGATIFARNVPAGLAPLGGSGWKANSNGTRFKYKGRTVSAAGGITKVVLVNVAFGRYKLKVIGKDADFQVQLGEQPVQVEIVLGGAAQQAAEQCAAIAFDTAQCAFNSSGISFKCR